MSSSPPSDTLKFAYTFGITLAITVFVYLLRGFGLLTFIPGGVIYLLILLSIATGIIYGIQKTRRY
ncbi:hypothetical protein [Lyngbya aestuarii]|uniref:hypothetical protein n=1 Tax=Lyngbya aestuarii TaxID=118322 RepID=UPI00403E2429